MNEWENDDPDTLQALYSDIKLFFKTYLLTYLNKDIYTKSVKSYKYFSKYISLV